MANRTKFTSRARKRFLDELRKSANVTGAAAAGGISRRWAYDLKAADPEFSKDWDEAVEIAADALEAEAHRRAVEGVLEPVFYLGQEVGKIRRYSDRMLEILLKGHKPDKFRERVTTEHTGAGGGPIAYSDLDRANRLLTLAKQRKAADPDGDA